MAKDKHLVIVESPAKARTIGKYLGPDYRVRASVGHIRDLPSKELGVDIENGFEPTYVTIRGKGKVILDLRRDAEGVAEVLLATDPDREGEAIAYHVAEQLGFEEKGAVPFRRVLFHEITKPAIQRAIASPVELDMKKVMAQQARRILDRLVGYKVSPLLWKPIRPGLSAGRVQTVALRLIVEREAEIRAFTAEEYWSITAQLERAGTEFEARLHHIDGKAFRLENETSATAVLDAIRGLPFKVTDIKRRERLKNPPAPFTTSTLQQEAAKRLGFTAQRTMRTAQQLYEGVDVGSEGSIGLITYMRTDSTRVSPDAANAARSWVDNQFGKRYLPDGGPRLWGGKQAKGAQEAHEAVRPTEATRTPDSVARYLERDQLRLYELIWLRFVGGQMSPAVYDTTTVDYDLKGSDNHSYLFRSTGSIVKFDGFTRLYTEAKEEGDHKTLDELAPLPDLDTGDSANLKAIVPAQHFTQPPPRFTEASLVKELERLGIGRPSTYAQIISTITDREYVKLEQKRFEPTPLGETVSTVLVRLFPDLFNVDFTSGMEGELDKIEEGELDWRAVLQQFYDPFELQLASGARNSEAVIRDTVSATDAKCEKCGKDMIVRWNRFGRFLGCSGYPECKNTQSLGDEKKPEPIPLGIPCPRDGGELVEREGRFGKFIACSNYPTCKYTQPKTIPGLHCPKCGIGEVGEKRTRRGKPFWGCTRYPDCDWSSWDLPLPIPCTQCDSKFVVKKSNKTRGEYVKCPKCNSEFVLDSQNELEIVSGPRPTPEHLKREKRVMKEVRKPTLTKKAAKAARIAREEAEDAEAFAAMGRLAAKKTAKTAKKTVKKTAKKSAAKKARAKTPVKKSAPATKSTSKSPAKTANTAKTAKTAKTTVKKATAKKKAGAGRK
jgi:DNA topoisomerase-1